MDKYDKLVKKTIKSTSPTLPNSKSLPILSVSYDMFDNVTLDNLKGIGKVVIYDQVTFNSSILLPKQLESRKRLLALISLSSVKEVELHLSDETLNIYNRLLQNFPMRSKIKYYLDVNRKPVSRIGLDKCMGELMLDEDDLMFEDIPNLSRVLSKEKYENTKELYDIVGRISLSLLRNFDISKLNDLERTRLIYRYIKKNIGFAGNCTYKGSDGVTRVREDMKYCQDPVQTFRRREGVCEGQTRLAKAILKSPWFKVDCDDLSGKISDDTSHAWLGVVVDDKLYQVCFTMNHFLENPGYVLYDKQNYPTIYRMATATSREVEIMDRNIEKSYRRGR